MDAQGFIQTSENNFSAPCGVHHATRNPYIAVWLVRKVAARVSADTSWPCPRTMRTDGPDQARWNNLRQGTQKGKFMVFWPGTIVAANIGLAAPEVVPCSK
jgi:hypothetical protein